MMRTPIQNNCIPLSNWIRTHKIGASSVVLITLIAVGLITSGQCFIKDPSAAYITYSGIALGAIDLLAIASILTLRKRKFPTSFSVTSLTMGTDDEFFEKIVKGKTVLLSEQGVPVVRRGLLNLAQGQLESDILCLHETGFTFDPQALRRTFPNHTFFQDTKTIDHDKRDTVIGFNHERFNLLLRDEHNFIPNLHGRNYNTQLALLQDKDTGVTVCAVSTHIRGENFEKEYSTPEEREGNLQLEQIVNWLDKDKFSADITVMGMKGNFTTTHANRRQYLTDKNFITNGEQATTQAQSAGEKLDHIYYRPRAGLAGASQNISVTGILHEAQHLHNPSTHTPTINQISVAVG